MEETLLTYPESFMSKCTIDATEAKSGTLNYVLGNNLKNSPLKFEQQILRSGLNELITFTSFEGSENLNYKAGNITIDEQTEEPDNPDESSQES